MIPMIVTPKGKDGVVRLRLKRMRERIRVHVLVLVLVLAADMVKRLFAAAKK